MHNFCLEQAIERRAQANSQRHAVLSAGHIQALLSLDLAFEVNVSAGRIEL
jgi:hypothetical protein